MKRKQMENVREEERSVVACVDKSIMEKMSVSSTGQAAMKHRDTGKFIGGVHNKTDNITSVKSIIKLFEVKDDSPVIFRAVRKPDQPPEGYADSISSPLKRRKLSASRACPAPPASTPPPRRRSTWGLGSIRRQGRHPDSPGRNQEHPWSPGASGRQRRLTKLAEMPRCLPKGTERHSLPALSSGWSSPSPLASLQPRDVKEGHLPARNHPPASSFEQRQSPIRGGGAELGDLLQSTPSSSTKLENHYCQSPSSPAIASQLGQPESSMGRCPISRPPPGTWSCSHARLVLHCQDVCCFRCLPPHHLPRNTTNLKKKENQKNLFQY